MEARDDRHLALLEGLEDATRADVHDPRLAMRRVSDDPRLRGSERNRAPAEIHDRHREESDRDALSGGQEHVQLARRRNTRDLGGKPEQLVGRVAHRRRDDADAPVCGGIDDASRYRLDPLGAPEGAAAVLLNDEGYGIRSRLIMRDENEAAYRDQFRP